MGGVKIQVKVKPNSKETRVEKLADGTFNVRVKAKPKEGEANAAVIEAIAGYFNVNRSRVVLIKGMTARYKVFEIL